MSQIVLATLNARYIHCAFGLRYLLANMGDLQTETALLEFTISQPTLEILDAILEQQPEIVGFGVYIWNVEETTRLISDLKRVRPDIVVVLGGPEVSYETETQSITQLADCVITGEADLAFAQFCREFLASTLSPAMLGESRGEGSFSHTHGPKQDSIKSPIVPILELNQLLDISTAQKQKPPHLNPSPRKAGARGFEVIAAPLPPFGELRFPYDFYTDDDIAHRVIYVEASRGCPFTCEFCLSALEIPVRQFPLDQFLFEIDRLIQRGARQFKFVDRTFNLNLRIGRAILQFFLYRYQPGMFLHFEMIPDRLPDGLKELIVLFPTGALQFEVGIQTFNPEVCKLISRQQDNELADANLRWLREHTGVHVHADLIVGLPGETLESFAVGFDRLVNLNPSEIQIGILKRLRGTPIIRHDQDWQMVYSPHPPYEILSNKLLGYFEIQELRRFAKYWDALANSGNFVESLSLLWKSFKDAAAQYSNKGSDESPFAEFRRIAQWLFEQERKTHGIPLIRLVELFLKYATEIKSLPADDVANALWRDYQRGGRSDKPHCLRPFISEPIDPVVRGVMTPKTEIPKRQARHQSK